MMIGTWLDIGPTNQIEPGTARTLPVAGGEEEVAEVPRHAGREVTEVVPLLHQAVDHAEELGNPVVGRPS